MTPTVATAIVADSAVAAEAFAPPARPHSALLHVLFSLGLFGLFFVALVDSSFVPLPLPGITDIMLIVLAARHTNILLLLLASISGSLVGGYLSYRAGYAGGISLLERHVQPRTFNLVREWMEQHAILSIAIPALLPPPIPLSPFVLAAGALKMSRKKFLTTFGISRSLRHASAIWLGVRYGRHVLRLWNHLSTQYATPILIVMWTAILGSAAFAFWKLYKTSRSVEAPQGIASHTRTVA
ncbi:VTT domain-containing protein [Edaphobacter bradus]|uniref:VTT domain-containing protein n=1 Tax=Edaphobacter bradus TaxID=2259016 RepID=UPI0021DFA99C|nr:VTT domain-containing protein [Edaphobacter bradus]